MKKRNIFLCVVSVSVLINAVLLLVFKDKAAFSIYSLAEIFLLLVAICNGIAVYFKRYECNYLYYHGLAFMPLEVDDRAVTKEYQNEFFWQFCVYWFVIPFCIPCIFFIPDTWGILLSASVCSVPYLIYFIYHICQIVKSEKTYPERKKKREQELKEQMMREELGHYK